MYIARHTTHTHIERSSSSSTHRTLQGCVHSAAAPRIKAAAHTTRRICSAMPGMAAAMASSARQMRCGVGVWRSAHARTHAAAEAATTSKTPGHTAHSASAMRNKPSQHRRWHSTHGLTHTCRAHLWQRPPACSTHTARCRRRCRCLVASIHQSACHARAQAHTPRRRGSIAWQ